MEQLLLVSNMSVDGSAKETSPSTTPDKSMKDVSPASVRSTGQQDSILQQLAIAIGTLIQETRGARLDAAAREARAEAAEVAKASTEMIAALRDLATSSQAAA